MKQYWYLKPLIEVFDIIPVLGVTDDGALAYSKDGDVCGVFEMKGFPGQYLDELTEGNLFNLKKEIFETLEDLRVSHYVYRFKQPLAAHSDNGVEGVSGQIIDRWSGQFSEVFMNAQYLVFWLKGGFGTRFTQVSAELCSQMESLEMRLSQFRPQWLKGSQLAAFFAPLVEGRKVFIPAHEGPIHFADCLGACEIRFGRDQVNYLSGDASSGAFLTMRQMGYEDGSALLDPLLSAELEFVLCQHFVPLAKDESIAEMKAQERHLGVFVYGKERLQKDVEELSAGLSADELCLLRHSLSVQIFAPDAEDLRRGCNKVVQLLESRGIRAKREWLCAEPMYHALFPFTSHFHPRTRRITSLNASNFLSLKGQPGGLGACSWGEGPVAHFLCSDGSGYGFGFHVDESRAALGHTCVVGGSGQGKTTLLSFLVTHCLRYQGFRAILFDKLRGMYISVLSQGGDYIDWSDRTTINPFHLEPTPDNLRFLQSFVLALLETETDEAKQVVSDAIRQIMEFPLEDRHMDSLKPLLGVKGAGSLHGKLTEWLGSGGRAGYFSTTDSFQMEKRLVGFDMGRPLGDPRALGVLSTYLLHLLETQVAGKPFLVFVDEFREYLENPIFSKSIQKMLQEYRKLDGVFVCAVQSADHIYQNSVGRANLENFATYLLFPAPQGSDEAYVDGFGCTKGELAWLRGHHSRQVMVKKGRDSVVLDVDLSVLREHLGVYDSSRDAVRFYEEIHMGGDSPVVGAGMQYA